MNKITMIKVFTNPVEANAFANEVRGEITIHYDWDYMLNSMIKEYEVRY